MVTRHKVKSCCNQQSLIFETNHPVLKTQANAFRAAGYLIAPSFYDIGVFYAQKGQLHATAAFGATKISVRCGGNNCPDLLDEFERVLDQAVTPKG